MGSLRGKEKGGGREGGDEGMVKNKGREGMVL